jgi:hypothetical protein
VHSFALLCCPEISGLFLQGAQGSVTAVDK